jgi:hypothetical protein
VGGGENGVEIGVREGKGAEFHKRGRGFQ